VRGPVAGFVSHLRDRCLRQAAANVVVGQGMAAQVAERGAATDRIRVIANWADDEAIRPIARDDNPLRREWGLDGKFVVGYSGNLGRAHEFDTVLAAAERLKDHPDIVFLCVGGGHRFAELARRGEERGVGRLFRFKPYQDQALLNASLCAADVHWISLRPEMEGLIVPSKLYGIAAAGRPVIAIMARDGEIASLVDTHDCGLVIEPGDGDALAAALTRLAHAPETCAAMGRRARAMLDQHFSRRQALARWRQTLAFDEARSSRMP
jgi:glycosyltransferase involved in cell wall biosynthesis